MGISLIRYKATQTSAPRWGQVNGERIFELPWEDSSLHDILSNKSDRLNSARHNASRSQYALSEVILLSPLTLDTTLLCQGLNYSQHQREVGLDENARSDEDNLIFVKSSAAICGARDDIQKPSDCQLLDYEAELGLVIGKTIDSAITISPAALKEYIAGLVICNDVSARDQQMGAPGMQWFKGKSYRTFCPTGPILYLLEDGELDCLYDITISLWVNGHLRLQASTSQLIHKPHDTLSYLSRFANMRPGDCLLTGTPGGVAFNMDLQTGLAILSNLRRDSRRKDKLRHAQKKRPDYLKPGDLVEVEIVSHDGTISLGRQHNHVKAA